MNPFACESPVVAGFLKKGFEGLRVVGDENVDDVVVDESIAVGSLGEYSEKSRPEQPILMPGDRADSANLIQ